MSAKLASTALGVASRELPAQQWPLRHTRAPSARLPLLCFAPSRRRTFATSHNDDCSSIHPGAAAGR